MMIKCMFCVIMVVIYSRLVIAELDKIQPLEMSNGMSKYEMRVRITQLAPDCFEMPIYTVNGLFQPILELTQGEEVEITVVNEVASNIPTVSGGVSIHWHGFDQRGYEWYDGLAHVTQCPIRFGSNFTYRFKVNSPPGTYLWHGHDALDRAQGLQGPLIVKAADEEERAEEYMGHLVLHLLDWYHTPAAVLAMSLNRPFDAAKQTNNTGGWTWMNNPQSILINGRGFYGDCDLGVAGSTVPIECDVENYWVPPGRSKLQPAASQSNPGCAHENVTLEADSKYLLHISSGATLVYMTLCIEGHNMTIVAADATPTQPLTVDCIDINSGQRYDVEITTSSTPGNFWIVAHPQFRPGSPAGYAVLRVGNTSAALPDSTPLQPDTLQPWTVDEHAMIVTRADLLTDADVSTASALPSLALPEKTKSIVVNITQPLMQQTGQLRWALNNVALDLPPPCTSLQQLIHNDKDWLKRNVEATNAGSYNGGVLGQQEGGGDAVSPVSIWTTSNTVALQQPVTGVHAIELNRGDVMEVVINNLPANANGGDYRSNGASRNATEQHPFHLHGHHFWLLGTGEGVFDPETDGDALNTENPIFRDTLTVFKGGWAVMRFVANNPGVWQFHCHIPAHLFMGQGLEFVEIADEISAPPPDMPQCPDVCTFNTAPWTVATVQEQFGATPYQIPLAG